MRSTNPKPLGAFAATLACAIALLGIGASAASAAPSAGLGWVFRAAFPTDPPSGVEPARNHVALDSSGNIFLGELGNNAMRIYAPDPLAGGKLVSTFSLPGSISVRNAAVDPNDSALYVDSHVAFGGSVIVRYVSDGQPTPTYTLDPGFEVPMGEGMAVDPTTGDLLVTDPGAQAVRRYDTSGTLVSTIETPGIAAAFVAPLPDGSFFVASGDGSDVLHLSGSGTLLGTITGVGILRGLTWDVTEERLIAVSGGTFKTYSAAGQLSAESPSKATDGIGLAYDPVEDLLYEAGTTQAYVYEPGIVPGVEAPVVSDIGSHSAHLSAEVEPGEGPPAGSKAHFEYSADGGKNWISTPDQTLTTSGVTTIEADLTGLLVNWNYLVRVKASNAQLTHVTAAVPFATPETAPEVITGTATDVTETSAALNGSINAAGSQTTYYFEYGTSTSYGSRIPVSIDGVAGSEHEARVIRRIITNLTPGTEYHYRLVAENQVGFTEGVDRTFTTASGDSIQRAYEQVTPIDKQGRPLDLAIGFQAKTAGSAIAYVSRSGDESSPQLSYAISRRGSDDWEAGIDLSVPFHAGGYFSNATTLAISDDFTHQFVATNQALTPGATPDGVNLYRVSIDSKSYELVGTAADPFSFNIRGFVAVKNNDKYYAAAPDLSWVVFKSEVPMVENAPPGALYKWSVSDGLEVVSVLPNDEMVPVAPRKIEEQFSRSVSTDGSKIYFEREGGGIYLREGQTTTPVSFSRVTGDSENPAYARLIGISEDGRYAFFGSFGGALTPDAPGTAEKESGDAYRYDAGDGSLKYLGAAVWFNANRIFGPVGVSGDGNTAYWLNQDVPGKIGLTVWRDGVLHKPVGNGESTQSIGMSPDGRYLGFSTDGQVWLYDADADQKACASCQPDGSPGGGFLPPREHFVSNRAPRSVTGNGQVFFTSSERLLAGDVNGTPDVYEFHEGVLRLISPGTGNFSAIFSDSSDDGSDVYFTTGQKLVGRDDDKYPDIYDARINGGLPAQSPPPAQECLRDDCKATPNAGPELPFGGSEALNGPENVKPQARKKCGRGKQAKKVKGKVRCVKKHRANKAGKGGNR